MSEKVLERSVTIKPLPVVRFHGKKDKESFARDKVVEALYNSRLGGYETGLTEEEISHYTTVLKRDLSSDFKPEEPHPFWGSKEGSVVLKNHTVKLDLTRPFDYIKYKLMKVSKFVANSYAEWEAGLWPDATHYIIDEEETVNDTAGKVQLINQCIQRLDKLTTEDKINMIQLMSNRMVKGRSTNFVDVQLDSEIRKDPALFLKYIDMGRAAIYDRSLILEALWKNVLNQQNSQIFYLGEFIGYDVDDAVKFVNSPANQRIKATLLEKITNLT